jgi:hypothetical protein
MASREVRRAGGTPVLRKGGCGAESDAGSGASLKNDVAVGAWLGRCAVRVSCGTGRNACATGLRQTCARAECEDGTDFYDGRSGTACRAPTAEKRTMSRLGAWLGRCVAWVGWAQADAENEVGLGAWLGRLALRVSWGTGRNACATGRRARLCVGTSYLGLCGGRTIWWRRGRGLGNS